jgi:sirohydrochlorin ferrochelatase
MSSPVPDHHRVGIVIVDHGSRRDDANRMLLDFVQLFRSHTSYRIVEAAHMELAEPSIAMAFDRCVAQAAAHVVVAPYFLSPGRHWDEDIPRLAAQAATKHPGVSYGISQPIGLHPLMVEVIRSRIEQCLATGLDPGPGAGSGSGR